MKRIVVALGGNAILSDNASAKAQQEALKYTSKRLIDLIKAGHELIISHGNGPQVGNLLLQQQAASSDKNPAMPLDTCVAMTQGSIGYWFQNALNEALAEENIDKNVVALVTQVLVDKEDPAFNNPTKPIGPFLSEKEARELMEKGEGTYKEDSGRGWRKVVPSPMPKSIIEYKAVEKLIENKVITISSGGGGVPVVLGEKGYEGVEAVIDKDLAAEKLAEMVNADLFIILTAVDNVYVNFNTPKQKKLERVSVEELKEYIEEGQFAPGSMLPKIQAAIRFVKSGEGRETIITSLEKVSEIDSNAGTLIYYK
ncbi:carbamate kinase [Alloiococcus sp. CFN-8]|uniref:carbamate kinase n=1 Tax=Alloiococcus sp. CFN-8 TaxID=3416081 RepID=UPI003CF61596